MREDSDMQDTDTRTRSTRIPAELAFVGHTLALMFTLACAASGDGYNCMIALVAWLAFCWMWEGLV